MPVLPGAAARRRRRRDERLTSLRGFAAGRGWSPRPALPSVVTRHPVPRLLAAAHAGAELVVGGAWRGRDAELSSVLVRPDERRASRGGGRDDVLLLAALEVPPVPGRLVVVVGGEETGATGSSASLAAASRPALLTAVRAGVLADGDCLALGEGSLAVAGAWRPRLAHEEALEAWFELLGVVAERLARNVDYSP